MTTKIKEFITLPDGRLNTGSASLYLGLSEATLAMKRCDGTGPEYVKIGGLVFYFKDALDKYIAAGKRFSTQQKAGSQLAG